MRVAFRVDATDRIGGGHAMRCLTLADALRERGAGTLFVAAAMPAPLEARIAAAGHGLKKIAAPDGLERAGEDWHEPPLAAAAQEQDSTASLAALGATADWIVVDHYLLGERWHSAARRGSDHIFVIDDLANRRLDCDLLLDQTFGRSAADYRGLVPGRAEVLAGASYALLRPEFARERPAALERRKYGGAVGRILISLGTTDIDGMTEAAVEAALEAAPECVIDVVLGKQAPSLPRLRELSAENPTVRLHIDTTEMAILMRNADLAIGAAGTTSWERCCMGLPSLALVLAENQFNVAQALAKAGVSVTIDNPAAIQAALTDLVAKPERLMGMSAAAFALVDGLGANRVTDKLSTPEELHSPVRDDSVHIRHATAADSERLWLWRNDPVTRQASQTSNPIAWSDHTQWLQHVLADPHRHLLMAERHGRAIGTVRFDPIDLAEGDHEVSINIRPDARGEGVGASILDAACTLFAAENGARTLYATVHGENSASRRLFEKCSFGDQGSFGDRGFHRYVLVKSVRSSDRPRSTA